MSEPADTFKQAFGTAEPRTAAGVTFTGATNQSIVDDMAAEVGAGWFRDGFLFMFGAGLDALRACLDAWSFVVPPNPRRVVIGRNAYGAILVVDNESMHRDERVFVLDPFTVSYTEVRNARFGTLLARTLPENKLPRFLDDSAYRAWLAQHGLDGIGPSDMLAVKKPEDLGGTMDLDNLQLEDIVSYYQETAPIYADAFAKLQR